MLRPYRANDLPAVRRFIGECWQRDKYTNYHPSDFVHWMSNGYLGESLEHHFHVVEEAEILAVVQLDAKSGSYAPVIHTRRRGGTWEREFHRACIAVMRERMKKTERKTLTVNFVKGDKAAKECLEPLGFKAQRSAYVQLKRSLETIPEGQLPYGFSIRSVAGEHEAQLVADVHNGAFGPKWTEAMYLKVMRTPGYDPEHELVVVAPDGRFAAFTVIWCDPISQTGLFEPVGCHSEFRRQGLTSALMYAGMARMKGLGMKTANVGCESKAAYNFYTSVGFETYFETVDYVLELKDRIQNGVIAEKLSVV